MGIKRKIDNIDECKKIEAAILRSLGLGKNNVFGVRVLSYKNKNLTIKTSSFNISNELKIIEAGFKAELQKEGIDIKKIRYLA